MPEDATWNIIRIARPQDLAVGESLMVRGKVYARKVPRSLAPQKAAASLQPVAEKSLEGSPLVRYELNYSGAQRRLRIAD